MTEYKVFAPGPAQLDHEVLEVLSRQVVYHRTDSFLHIFNETHELLKDVFNTKNGRTLINTGSGTNGMDNLVLNLIEEGEKVLVINTGFFGERFVQINNKYNNNVIELKYNLGQTYNLEDVKKIIAENNDLKAIFVTHCDTSCGILNELKPLGELTKSTDILLVVDSISGIIMNELDFDGWYLDAVVSSSQKGFMLPPGLNIACLSEKAINKLSRSTKAYYNNYLDQFDYIDRNYLFCTVNTPMICALNVVVKRILKNGVAYYNDFYSDLYDYLKGELLALGFELYPLDNKSNSLIVFTPPTGIESDKLAEFLYENKIIIGIGFGELIHKVNRIGIMNAITKEDCVEMIELIKEYLCHMDI